MNYQLITFHCENKLLDVTCELPGGTFITINNKTIAVVQDHMDIVDSLVFDKDISIQPCELQIILK